MPHFWKLFQFTAFGSADIITSVDISGKERRRRSIMGAYVKPVILQNEDLSEGVFAASGSDGSCLSVTSWLDGQDGSGSYRIVFKVQHTGHQSYGQTIVATLSTSFTVVETDGTVSASVSGNTLTLVRNNQLNDTGLVELWVKVNAATQPTVLSVAATHCEH